MSDPGSDHQPARATVAAGVLFVDQDERIMLVHPVYKDYWDIPGGYVEPGETPREACARELQEELGIQILIGRPLVVDWAPHPDEGDKVLFIFDADPLTNEQHDSIELDPRELDNARYMTLDEAKDLLPGRLARRLSAALDARRTDSTLYLEHGRALPELLT